MATTTYEISPITTKEERLFAANSIPYIRKGNTARFSNQKDFVRATFQLVLPYLPTEKDLVKGVL
jgi:hypothetical protein